MRTIKKESYENLVKIYKSTNIDEEQILNSLNTKPICVHIDILKSEYEELHTHKYYEIIYIEKGNLFYEINNIVYYLSPGDMIFIPKGINHRLLSFESEKISRYILLCSEKFLRKHSSKQTSLFLVFKTAIQNNNFKLSLNTTKKLEIERILPSISKMMLENYYGVDLIYALQFIKGLITITDLSIQVDEEDKLLHHPNIIVHNIIAYISLNISKKITIEDIAKSLALSTSRISHLFKSETGLTINKYINKKRISLAKELIERGETFNNIAIECGFQDYTSFFRTFKKDLNMTPGEYLKIIRVLDN